VIIVTHSELENQIRRCFEVKLPLYIHGTFGIGKSEVVREVAKKLAKGFKKEFVEGKPNGAKSFCLIDMRLSQLEPTDLLGLPNFTENDKGVKVVKWITPEWLPQDKDSSGIIFLDELSNAMPSIQHACYQLVLDRKLGNYKLPDNWIVIAGGNLSTDNGGIFALPIPLANRFVHIQLNIPDKKSWVEWAFKNSIDTRIIAFIEWKPTNLYKYEKGKSDYSVATPRSWAMTSKLISGVKNLDELSIYLKSSVGEGIGTEFIAFLKLQEKLDIDNLLNNPEKVKEIEELSEKYALLTGVCERILEKPTDVQLYDKILNFLEYLEPEFSILLIRFLRKNAIQGLKKDKKLDMQTDKEAEIYLVEKILSKCPFWKKHWSRFAKYYDVSL
jgi:MoxR-like ATPase